MNNNKLITPCNNCPSLEACCIALCDDIWTATPKNIDCEYYIPLADAIKKHVQDTIRKHTKENTQ